MEIRRRSPSVQRCEPLEEDKVQVKDCEHKVPILKSKGNFRLHSNCRLHANKGLTEGRLEPGDP